MKTIDNRQTESGTNSAKETWALNRFNEPSCASQFNVFIDAQSCSYTIDLQLRALGNRKIELTDPTNGTRTTVDDDNYCAEVNLYVPYTTFGFQGSTDLYPKASIGGESAEFRAYESFAVMSRYVDNDVTTLPKAIIDWSITPTYYPP